VIDLTSFTVRAISEKSVWAVPLAFVSGAAVSVGPCVAPRVLSIAALTARKPFLRAAQIAGSFIAGLAVSYILLAMSGSLIWRLAAYSNYAYLAVAGAMATAGLITLMRRDVGCAHEPPAIKSLGATFLLGASSAATVSPCCFPIIIAATTYAGNAGIILTSATAGAFALGHSAPLLFVAGTTRCVAARLSQRAASRAVQVISASLMLALAGFYGVLA